MSAALARMASVGGRSGQLDLVDGVAAHRNPARLQAVPLFGLGHLVVAQLDRQLGTPARQLDRPAAVVKADLDRVRVVTLLVADAQAQQALAGSNR